MLRSSSSPPKICADATYLVGKTASNFARSPWTQVEKCVKVFSSRFTDNPGFPRRLCAPLSTQARFTFHHEKSKPMNQKNCVGQHKSNALVSSQRNKSNSPKIAKTEKTSCASVESQRFVNPRGNLNNHQMLNFISATLPKLPKERIPGRRVQVRAAYFPVFARDHANSSRKTGNRAHFVESTFTPQKMNEWNMWKVLSEYSKIPSGEMPESFERSPVDQRANVRVLRHQKFSRRPQAEDPSANYTDSKLIEVRNAMPWCGLTARDAAPYNRRSTVFPRFLLNLTLWN
jgi:hypothetical protein